jgi:hypothetical protein
MNILPTRAINYDADINVALAEMPESLNDQAAGFPGDSHVPRRSPLENDLQLPDLNAPVDPIGQEHDFHGHLVGKAKQIGGISARWLQPNCAWRHWFSWLQDDCSFAVRLKLSTTEK